MQCFNEYTFLLQSAKSSYFLLRTNLSSLITLSEITKQHGSQVLFKNLSLSISEGDRIGVVGPNGAGKSTLMKIIAGESELDQGRLIQRKDLRICYAPQSAVFETEKTIYQYAIDEALKHFHFEDEAERVARNSLARLNFENFEAQPNELSGGQKKRLQLALALCGSPDLLILDEPTNHLDIESILLLEQLLQNANFAWIVVSHDRWFLQKAAKRMLEVNRYYPEGAFICDGNYDAFLDRRDEFMEAEQKRISSLANTARREQAWLRQGAKARSTKAKHRVVSANEVIESLSEVQQRTQARTVNISFSETDRKTKRLLELKSVSKAFEERPVIEKLSTTILSGQIIGLLGKNGSGKTTLINMLTSTLTPDYGSVNPVIGLSIAHFQQFAETINPKTPLKEVLSPDSDSIVFKGQEIHVAAWAQRFSFSFDQLYQPYESLSGGERARARIAKLMLTTADLLILDEPTNDLDIDTLDILEQSLLDFNGAVVLVTHDRYMIARLCTHFIGLDGKGGWQNYADYEQWQREITSNTTEKKTKVGSDSKQKSNNTKKKLPYKEQRELNFMEQTIQELERQVSALQEQIALAPANIHELCLKLTESQQKVESLYHRWAELEAKIA